MFFGFTLYFYLKERRYCNYSGDFVFFAPQGRRIALVVTKFGRVDICRAKFHVRPAILWWSKLGF